jgi:hypothetical protein
MRNLAALTVILALSLSGAGICWSACDDDEPDGSCGPTCDQCSCCPSTRALDFAPPAATTIPIDLGCVEAAASSPELLLLPVDIPHVPRSFISQQTSS